MNDRTCYFIRFNYTEDAMTTDPRVPFSVSLHKSAADKIERYVAKIVRAENVKRGAVIERMLLESIKKEEA